MAAAKKLTDFRNDIDEVLKSLRAEKADGDVPVNEAIACIRERLKSSVDTLTEQLIDLTLRKLIHDVGNRKRLTNTAQGNAGLFSEYNGVPAMITTAKGRKKDTTKATFVEIDKWLVARSHEQVSVRSEIEKTKAMVEDLRRFMTSASDTLEDAAKRKVQTELSQDDLLEGTIKS